MALAARPRSGRLQRLLNAAVEAGDTDEVVTRKRLFVAGGLLVPMLLLGLGIVYLVYGALGAGLDYSCYAVWLWLNVALFTRHHRLELTVWLVAVPALVGGPAAGVGAHRRVLSVASP